MKKHNLVYIIVISIIMLLLIVSLFLALFLRKSPKYNSAEKYKLLTTKDILATKLPENKNNCDCDKTEIKCTHSGNTITSNRSKTYDLIYTDKNNKQYTTLQMYDLIIDDTIEQMTLEKSKTTDKNKLEKQNTAIEKLNEFKKCKKTENSLNALYKDLQNLKYSFDSNEIMQNIDNVSANFPNFFIYNAICYSDIHHKVDESKVRFKTSLVSSLLDLQSSIISNNSLELYDLALSVKDLITFLSGRKFKPSCHFTLPTKNNIDQNEIQMVNFPKKLEELYGAHIKKHGTKWTKAIYEIIKNDIEKNEKLQSELIYNYIGGNGYTGPLTNDSLLKTSMLNSISKDVTAKNVRDLYDKKMTEFIRFSRNTFMNDMTTLFLALARKMETKTKIPQNIKDKMNETKQRLYTLFSA